MRQWLARLLTALAVLALLGAPAGAVDPKEFMRPCRRQDLIGVWRVLRFGFAQGAGVDRTDPAYLPHQRYVFHSNATMTHVTQDVPFTTEEQRGLLKLPASTTWAMESGGRLLRQRDGVPTVEKADCKVMLEAVVDPKSSQPRAQRGDVLLTDETADQKPVTRRLLRKIRGLAD
jgi:hypothetical protein